MEEKKYPVIEEEGKDVACEPVATVAVGKAGAKNAAYLAAQILALTDPEIDAKVKADRKAASEEVMKKDLKLQEKLVNI